MSSRKKDELDLNHSAERERQKKKGKTSGKLKMQRAPLPVSNMQNVSWQCLRMQWCVKCVVMLLHPKTSSSDCLTNMALLLCVPEPTNGGMIRGYEEKKRAQQRVESKGERKEDEGLTNRCIAQLTAASK